MIATYVQELLASNNRVIVPNYGAFLVRATSKSKDATTLAEKLKDVYFSPFLKFNDELLEKYIIKKENVTKEQASEKIIAFINDVKKELEAEIPYKIEGFGEFVADKQGKVQFLTVSKDAVEKTPAKKEVKKPAKETKAPDGKKPDAKTSKPIEKKEKLEEKPKAKETKPVESTIKKEEAKVEAKPESKLKEFKPETKQTPAATTTSIYSTKKEKKPINKGLVWAIALGLPIAAIFIWGLLNFSTVKELFQDDISVTEKTVEKKKPATKKPDAKADQTKKETAKKETATKTNAAKTETTKKETEAETKPAVQKPATTGKKYYIIAGSFKNEKYAFSYMNKLKAEGYNAEKLKERNGMHAVSFNSFADKKKAIAEYKYLSTEKGLQAWILYL